VNETRYAHARARATSISFARRNRKASFDRSSSVSRASSSRELGPARCSVAQPLVTSVTVAPEDSPDRSSISVRR
jgi:hypothetical protein